MDLKEFYLENVEDSDYHYRFRNTVQNANMTYNIFTQVIAKLARLVRNLERKQGRIRAEHEFWNEKWITGHFRRTLISYGLYESGKS